MKHVHITAILLDIGDVLLTNRWDCRLRQEAAAKFGLDYEEMNERHHLTFEPAMKEFRI
jgi:putative hydrolase of the HAD superfamily